MIITKIIKQHLEGFILCGADLPRAKKKLKKAKNGTYFILSAYNGYNTFIKENNKVRQATRTEDIASGCFQT